MKEGNIKAEEVALLDSLIKLPIENAPFQYGKNPNSRFTINDTWVGWGSDIVPGTGGYTASQVAEMYKPYFVRKESDHNYPTSVNYRVFKRDDPYTTTTNDQILILYSVFFCRQETTSSKRAFSRHSFAAASGGGFSMVMSEEILIKNIFFLEIKGNVLG